MHRKPWAFGIVYVGLSLGVEASLIIFGRLRIPEDIPIIAPIILTIPPILAAILTGYRKPREFLTIVGLTAGLTLVITFTVIRITGISTGFVEPIFNRFIAGFLAAYITNRINAQVERKSGNSEMDQPADAE